MRKRWLVTTLLSGLLVVGARADGDAVALVNGHPITQRKMVDTLMESHGLQILQQLVVLELAQQETRRRGLRVTSTDVDREFRTALKRIAPEADLQGAALNEEEQRQVLDRLLAEKGLSFTEFMLGMERNAHLRKIVNQDLQIDEATLREEYARLHGEKVEVRHIRVSDIDGLHEALNRLESGEDFATVARAVSEDPESAARGGMLPPFSFTDSRIAPQLREQAFSLDEGQRGAPIKVGRWWFLLKLERRLPPENVRFADVRAEVERELRARVVPEKMNELVVELFRKAEIRVLNRELRPKFEELLKNNAVAPTMQR